METDWLKVFAAIARLGSFTAAARELGYTQSAVSRQVAALESDLKTPLFERLPRGVRLTEAGRRLAARAEVVLDQLGAARRELAGLRDGEVGHVRIGCFPTAGARLVPEAIAAFRAAHPRVTVTHVDALTSELVRRVADGALDVAVVGGYRDRIAGLTEVRLHHLWDEPILVAVPPGHRLADRRSVRVAELAGESWIAGSDTPGETLISAFLRHGPAPRVEYIVREWTAKLGFVAAGLGVTLVPALAAGGLRGDVPLLSLHPDDAPLREVHAATSPHSAPAPAVRGFLRALARTVSRWDSIGPSEG
ncbi:DNA-binding transcriptional LysR family regulator [Stackebrandtia albiflava]|uniref:DNA-binding transcriptional LysR family regulator n=1 Tax=Stackebrandtia albiflava TaxID=406432 RepID=A0A562UQH2_9ACTN|nr:DNA-binding transcriptional LysR family regulator [Stackebrandtia albiflava]